ncbi:hypothetical protein L211DRAFT_521912 [Terfezia boudieri ATCC MYA-4762]|uniref:Uncharacterized protein n=1 Tax=Terfezia boudieri ATCC MYA-4762 TaxID=1051890 RepID=A0A3N4LCR7_9PEZI|nr:hypothetical protein L211DRAFT_521912 [Terfezia boudieri ATCC MYA-4762]
MYLGKFMRALGLCIWRNNSRPLTYHLDWSHYRKSPFCLAFSLNQFIRNWRKWNVLFHSMRGCGFGPTHIKFPTLQATPTITLTFGDSAIKREWKTVPYALRERVKSVFGSGGLDLDKFHLLLLILWLAPVTESLDTPSLRGWSMPHAWKSSLVYVTMQVR